MYKLEKFLVKEGYCNTEREAGKILESISDEFYDFLLEGVEDNKVSKMRQELKVLMSKILSETDPQKKQALGDEYKELKAKIDSSAQDAYDVRKVRDAAGSSSLSSRPTPRGIDGRRPQTDEDATTKTSRQRERETGCPMSGNRLNNPRFAAAAEQETSRQTGTSAEVGRAGGASRQKTGVVRTGKYTNMQSGGGATVPVPNQGISRTGAQFPRQQG